MRVLVTGAAGSLGRVVTVGLTEPRPRRRRARPGARARGDDLRLARGRLRRRRRRRRGVRRGAARRGGAPRRRARGGLAARGAHLARRSPPQPCSTRWSPTGCRASSTPPPTTPSAARPRAAGELTEHALPRPDTYYGVAKVAAEALLQLFADRHGIDAVACRIGSFLEEPTSLRGLSTWLSHDDGVRMVEAALTAPAPGFAVLYGISANTRGLVGPRAGPSPGLRAPGRRRGVRRPDRARVPRTRPRRSSSAARSPCREFHRPALGD